MILATIPIPHSSRRIAVEVVGAFTYQGRRIATVRAVDGSQPFPHYTHGGWCYSASKDVPAEVLADVCIKTNFPIVSEAKECVV